MNKDELEILKEKITAIKRVICTKQENDFYLRDLPPAIEKLDAQWKLLNELGKWIESIEK